MDNSLDDSSADRILTLGDYMRGYTASTRPTSDSDQFARPIEDEDIFGLYDHIDVNEDKQPSEHNGDSPFSEAEELDLQSGAFEGVGSSLSDGQDAGSPHHILEDDSSTNKSPAPPPALTPAQIAFREFQEKLKQQTINLKPKISTDLKDGTIEFTLEQKRSDSDSKVMFNKIFNRSKKANNSPTCPKMTLDGLRDSIRKRISADKRKIWDSFQQPVDNFDEEEELIEEPEQAEVEEDGQDNATNDELDESNDENKSPNDNDSVLSEQEDNDEGSEVEEIDEAEDENEDSVGAFDIEDEPRKRRLIIDDDEESW